VGNAVEQRRAQLFAFAGRLVASERLDGAGALNGDGDETADCLQRFARQHRALQPQAAHRLYANAQGNKAQQARVIDHQFAAAAGCAGPVPGTADLVSCLQAYYRHVADDDLTEAGPERLAAVLARHAEFAAHRPQGRALVDVRPGGDAVLRPPADVIDIVTDDMPFLVDSITMELANHGLSARVIVHPQLRVRRDVTGALREIVGPVGGPAVTAADDHGAGTEYGHDELAESWTHIEIPPLAAGEAQALVADLIRVLSDVRVAVEDYPRMRAKALWLADEVVGVAPGSPAEPEDAEAPAEIAALLRWLIFGRFTFQG